MTRIFGIIFAVAVGVWASSIIADAAQNATESFRGTSHHVSGDNR